jgi:hypothetical protein
LPRRPAFPAAEVLHLALGTSMAVILFTSLSSLLAHHRHGAVLWPIVVQITPGFCLARCWGRCWLRACRRSRWQSSSVPSSRCVAVQMILNLKPKAARELPGRAAVLVVGSRHRWRSRRWSPIGGGALTVPFLTWCNVRVQHAIGTSAAVGFPIAAGRFAGLSFSTAGGIAELPPWSLGYVYLPASDLAGAERAC